MAAIQAAFSTELDDTLRHEATIYETLCSIAVLTSFRPHRLNVVSAVGTAHV